ncbi:MAG: nuclear transport factor 2 family protein [Gemmatimonadetes bacterium]|nr:nuclear transport factor 2 family protein [Gemmatimonadota bacterium]
MTEATHARFIQDIHLAFLDGDPVAVAKQAEAENVRRLQEQYSALVRGEFGGPLAELMDEEVEMEIVGAPGAPFTGTWRGREEVLEAVRRNFAMIEDQDPEIQAVVAQGDTVVVFARERGHIRPGHRPYEMHWMSIFNFRDGKVVRIREMVDTAALLQAMQPVPDDAPVVP